jgi:hypothetical protein
VTVLTPCGGVGKSDRYRLKRIGDRTPPCGTPVLMNLFLDWLLLYKVYAVLPLM